MTSSTRRWRTVSAVALVAVGKLGHAHARPLRRSPRCVGHSRRAVRPVSVVTGEVCGVRKDYEIRTQLPNICSTRVSTSSNGRATNRTGVLSNTRSPQQPASPHRSHHREVTMSAIAHQAPIIEHAPRSTRAPRAVPTGPDAVRAARAARATEPPLRLTRLGRLVVALLIATAVARAGRRSRRPAGDGRLCAARRDRRLGRHAVRDRRPRAARACRSPTASSRSSSPTASPPARSRRADTAHPDALTG